MGKKKTTVIDIPEDTEAEKMVYACLACRAIFKDAGMCPNCNLVLKKRAG